MADKYIKKPYVYRLIDPRDGVTFYVGKGIKGRAWAHQKIAKSTAPDNNEKRAKILEIIAAGHDVKVEIVSVYETHEEAFQAEIKLIAEIGLNNLTNMTPGGEGWSCFVGGVRKPTVATHKLIVRLCLDILMPHMIRRKKMAMVYITLFFHDVLEMFQNACDTLGPEKSDEAFHDWLRRLRKKHPRNAVAE